MNSFISWVGGKKLLRKYIINEFPKDYKRYVEVFGGAGWVLFGLEHIGKTEIYNDKDSDLVNLFRSSILWSGRHNNLSSNQNNKRYKELIIKNF